MVLDVLKFPHPLLAKKAATVTRFDADLAGLAADMLETMYEEGGVGLAAIQVGQLKRLIVVDVRAGEGEEDEARRTPRTYVNPELLSAEGEIVSEEGCLSVVDFTAEVRRAARVRMAYQDLQGRRHEETLDDLAAICVQHEIDHLDGKLFIDRLSPLKRQMVKKKLTKLARSA